MKKCVSVLLAVLLLAGFCATAFADSTVYTEGYFKYIVEDGSITIIEYFGSETEVTVPASIAGVPVNAVAPGAFAGTHVTKVNLPDTVTAYQSGEAQLEVVFDANTDHPYSPGDALPEEGEAEGEDVEIYDEATVDLEEKEEWDTLRDSDQPEEAESGEAPADGQQAEGQEGDGAAAGEEGQKAGGIVTGALVAGAGGLLVLAGILFLTRKKKEK